MLRGTWTDPERGKIALADYAATWISQRPKLRPRTVDHYRWLLKKHIAPHLGTVPLGKLSTPMIRQWRATLLGDGVSVSVAATASRLLRAVLMTATEDDKILTRNPCRIRGAGDEETAERRCSLSPRSSSWPSASAAARWATSASSWRAATGSASGGTA
jgi:Phage integrase, N-terminal SAM-like domain